MLKKVLFSALALIACGASANVVVPLNDNIALPLGKQMPADKVKFFYVPSTQLPTTSKTIVLECKKEPVLQVKDLKAAHTKDVATAFSKKQNVSVLFAHPTAEKSFVLQVTFDATATKPEPKKKQMTWTDVRVYGLQHGCPAPVEAFVKLYVSPKGSWLKTLVICSSVVGGGAGLTIGCLYLYLGNMFGALSSSNSDQKPRRNTPPVPSPSPATIADEVINTFVSKGNEKEKFVRLQDIQEPDGSFGTMANTWAQHATILVFMESECTTELQNFFRSNLTKVTKRCLFLNDKEDAQLLPTQPPLITSTILWDTGFTQNGTPLGHRDGRPVSVIRQSLKDSPETQLAKYVANLNYQYTAS